MNAGQHGAPLEVITAWAQYAKERYEAQEKRLMDLRNWARQLAAGMGAVVGLEAALMLQMTKPWDGIASGVWIACLLFLLGVAAYQLLILGRAVRLGYVGKELLGAESPVILAAHLEGKDQPWVRRTIGAYYAKGADNVHAVAEGVAKDVAVVAQRFRLSLGLLFAVMVLTGGLGVVSSQTRKTMADDPGSSGPASTPDSTAGSQQPSAGPSPVAPASPLLVTPTPGQTESHGASPSSESAVLSTPTPGQRLTEGVDGKRR